MSLWNTVSPPRSKQLNSCFTNLKLDLAGLDPKVPVSLLERENGTLPIPGQPYDLSSMAMVAMDGQVNVIALGASMRCLSLHFSGMLSGAIASAEQTAAFGLAKALFEATNGAGISTWRRRMAMKPLFVSMNRCAHAN